MCYGVRFVVCTLAKESSCVAPKVYGSYFLFLQEQMKDIIIILTPRFLDVEKLDWGLGV
jgi:hypothetical protein